ncbi:MAG: 1,4-dihydroxy-6-naphthoate synthase [Bacteroidales bacterium]|nr:1,4-dihydroxy-6-naphthoate synthase [Bacteroidales bacterium]
MKLTLGFSPCPNDTFIFHGIVNHKVDTEGLEFDIFMADVEELNRTAFEGTAPVLKLSYHAYAHASGKYLILDSGGAIGRGSGPLVISKRGIRLEDLDNLLVAIPGQYTTANLLFGIFRPGAVRRKVYLFSDIPDAVLNEEVDAGIIIHETRFTYRDKGLRKVADLGQLWEDMTGLPVPLGAIAVNRKIPEKVAHSVNRIIRRSIEYAKNNIPETYQFIKQHSQEISDDVIGRHIELYVNSYTESMGEEGRNAVSELYRRAAGAGVIPELPERIFLHVNN